MARKAPPCWKAFTIALSLWYPIHIAAARNCFFLFLYHHLGINTLYHWIEASNTKHPMVWLHFGSALLWLAAWSTLHFVVYPPRFWTWDDDSALYGGAWSLCTKLRSKAWPDRRDLRLLEKNWDFGVEEEDKRAIGRWLHAQMWVYILFEAAFPIVAFMGEGVYLRWSEYSANSPCW